MLYFSFFILLLAGIDQFIKEIVRRNLGTQIIEVIPNFISLTHQENRGVSFSFLSDAPDSIRIPLLVGGSSLIVVLLFVYVFRSWDKISFLEKWGFAFILSGALGNLWDRAFRDSVTDYMYFHFYENGFFVNNFADDLISIGFVFLVIKSFSKKG